MDPVLSRQMFSGQKPSAEGSGITSLVSGPEEGNSRAALYSVAKATDKFSSDVQGAEDYEQLMQAIRGDDLSVEDRRSELAAMVGVADAERTPISVLTILQPAVEMLKGGGIASLGGGEAMPSEEPAPMAEEPMAFANGGFVSRFAEGGAVEDPETTGAVRPTTANPEMDSLFRQYKTLMDTQLGERRSLQQMMRERQELFGQDNSAVNANLALMNFGARVATTPGGLLTALAKPMPELGQELGKIADKKTDRDRMVKADALNAFEKDKDRRVNAGLSAAEKAFTEYNSRIGRREGQAFTAGENEKQRDHQLQIQFNEQSARMQEAERARTFQREERVGSQEFTAGQGDKDRNWRSGESAIDRELRIRQQREGFDHTSSEAEKARQAQRDNLDLQFQRQKEQQIDAWKVQAAGQGRTLYLNPTDPSAPPIVGKMTPEGPVMVNGSPLPENYLPYDEKTKTIFGIGKIEEAKEAKPYLTPDGGIVMGVQQGKDIYVANGKGAKLPAGSSPYDASKFKFGNVDNYVVEDPNAPLGLRQIGVYEVGGSRYEATNTGAIPLGADVKIHKGKLEDFAPASVDGKTTKYIVRVGPMQGQTIEVQAAGANSGVDEKVPTPAQIQKSTEGLTPQGVIQQKEANFDPRLNRYGIKVDEVGEIAPFVKVMPAPTISGKAMSDKDREEARRRIEMKEAVLTQVDQYLEATLAGTGPINNLKSLANNTIGAFGVESATFTKTEVAKGALEQLRNAIRGSETLSKQYAVSEMKIIDEMIANPDKFFSNPKTSMLRLQDMFRSTRNELEREKARLTGQPYVEIARIPTGRSDDPFVVTESTAKYLEEQQKKGIDLTGVYLKFPNGRVLPYTKKEDQQ